MSLSTKQLLAINGLNLSGIVDEMDNSRLGEYCKALYTFTENFPTQETELKNFFSAKDYAAFAKALLSIRDMLENIYSTDLARSSNRLLKELDTQKYNIVEAHLIYLLAEISELSIAIQMAWQRIESTDEPDTEILPVKKSEAPAEDNLQRSILAVDDVSLTLNALKLALEGTKYKLSGVKSGAEALKFIRSHKPDLFVLDIEMPEMDGYELAHKIRDAGQTAPIIFLTGNARQDYVFKAIEAGAADFIVKPVNKENVLEKIKKYLG